MKKIGVFDSGFGGLTILKSIRNVLPEYDYIYLGDSARAPYGTRSFEVIYQYTLQAVRYLQEHDCRLIIIACNTASAKALRTIQQRDIDPEQLRVLGVIRPTAEAVADGEAERQKGREAERHIGVLATPGTVSSESYILELRKLNPNLIITQQACPLWVELIENNRMDSPEMEAAIRLYMDELLTKDPEIETIILGCTHYPLIQDKIEKALLPYPSTPLLLSQGDIVAHSLKDYLHRHPEIDKELRREGSCVYLTTDVADKFDASASLFLGEHIHSKQVTL